MRPKYIGRLNTTFNSLALGLVLSAGIGSAQESPAVAPNTQTVDSNAHRWRKATEPAPAPESTVAQSAPAAPDPANPPSLQGRGPLAEFGQPRAGAPQAPGLARPAGRFPDSIPDQLTIKPGTYLTVRVDQPLSSDHNQPGDAFTATLVKPLVVDGVVVMQRGQTIAGAVAEAQKAGRVQGVSRLAVHVTELTLVDGQQVPVRTQLVSRTGPTSLGSDAGAIAATTATGAAIGAMADWGTGAAIGAGAGAVAGLVGVLLTRGHETLIVPEMLLTFRVEAPVTVMTARAPQAFRYVEPEDYAQASFAARPAPSMMRQPPVYYRQPAFYYGPALYAPYWGPRYWGPGMGVYFGPGFYRGGRGYYHARWH